MKLISKSFLLILFVLSAHSIFAQNIVEDGSFYLKEQQYEMAVKALKNELANAPTDANLNFLLGEAYFAQGNLVDAKNAYTLAATNLKSPWGFLGLGKIELQSGNKIGALSLFDKSIKLDKKNPSAYASVAMACLQVTPKDTSNARLYIERGVEVSNKNGMIQMVKGDLNLTKKNYGLSANDYERVLLYNKASYVAYRKLGEIYTAAKDFNDAKKNFEESLLLAPNQILGYKEYSDLYYMFAKYAEANKYYSVYYSKVSPTIDETERYAFILFFNKEYKEASALLDKVLEEKGPQAKVAIYRLKGYICFESGETVQGLDYMNKLFAAKDTSELLASDYGYYARLLAKDKQDSLAIINYKLAIGKEENPMDYLDELSKVYFKAEMYDNAIDVYSCMMSAGGSKASGNYSMGKAFYQKGDLFRKNLYALTPIADSKGRVAPMPIEADSVNLNMVLAYTSADSCFSILNTLSPTYASGYLYRGRIQSILDPESKLPAGKDFFEKTIEVLNASGDKEKSKKIYIECYNFLGSYYYLNSERAKGAESKALKDKSISYFQLILDIDPTDAIAKDKIEKLKVTLK